jgi:hypothetical protein
VEWFRAKYSAQSFTSRRELRSLLSMKMVLERLRKLINMLPTPTRWMRESFLIRKVERDIS